MFLERCLGHAEVVIRRALLIALFALLAACGGTTSGAGDGSGGSSAVASGGAEALGSGGSGGGVSSGGMPGSSAESAVDAEEWAAWQATAAPRTGPHDVWTRDECNGGYVGSKSEPIGQESRVLPSVGCRVSADLAVNERDCSVASYCETSADCTDGLRGRCEGHAEGEYPFCYYPGYYPEPPPVACSSDADCTAAPAGHCPTGTEIQNAWHCYPWEVCLPPVPYCTYPSLYEVGCQGDADCTALPAGECVKPIRNVNCWYDTCFEDEDCDAGTRCGCGRCIEADCDSNSACIEGESCELSIPQCGEERGFHCTTPEDECEPSDPNCVYEEDHFVQKVLVCE